MKKKRLIKEIKLFFLGVICGYIFAFILPFTLPGIEKKPSLESPFSISVIVNTLLWTTIFYLIEKSMNFVPSTEKKIKKSLQDFENKIGQSFYQGFHSLLAGSETRTNLESFQNNIMTATDFDSTMKIQVIDFIINSIANIGKNGFAMIDANVSQYVGFIKNCMMNIHNKDVSVICAVRPFWFLTDQATFGDDENGREIVLQPTKKDDIDNGKSDHLPFLVSKPNRNQNIRCQRIQIINERILAEILVTAFMDLKFYESDEEKKYVKLINRDKTFSENVDDVFEIYWFKNFMNEECNYWYTFIKNTDTLNKEELTDSVTFISNNEFLLSVQFQFLNLEKGISRIKWGNANYIPFINSEEESYRIERFGYDLYKNMDLVFENTSIYDDNVKNSILNYFTLLQDLIEDNFNEANVMKTYSGNAQHAYCRKLLFNGKQQFKKRVIQIIDDLKSSINDIGIIEVYQQLKKHFKTNGVPEVFYSITYDTKHVEYPIRIVSWKKNWEEIKENAKKE